MKLYAERLRRAKIESLEAEGESFWTSELEATARTKLQYAIMDLLEAIGPYRKTISKDLTELLCRQIGLDIGHFTSSSGYATHYHFVDAIDSQWTVEVALSAVELAATAGRVYRAESPSVGEASEQYEETVADILNSHRVAVRLVEGKIVPIESEALHVEVVEPVLRLFFGDSVWDPVQAGFMAALEELHGGKPEDAITDAVGALQEALKLVGGRGTTVSAQMKDLSNRGILSPYDKHMANWFEAERSAEGDVHNTAAAEPVDAWLMLHVVGAWILRISHSVENQRGGREGGREFKGV